MSKEMESIILYGQNFEKKYSYTNIKLMRVTRVSFVYCVRYLLLDSPYVIWTVGCRVI